MNLEAMSSSSVLYSVEYTAISALEFGQNNIENQLIKPRKNSPFRTHPLRARIILALIGCCSDHGSRRGQLAGHRALRAAVQILPEFSGDCRFVFRFSSSSHLLTLTLTLTVIPNSSSTLLVQSLNSLNTLSTHSPWARLLLLSLPVSYLMFP